MNIKEKPFQKGYSIRKRVLRFLNESYRMQGYINDTLFIKINKSLINSLEGESIVIQYNLKTFYRQKTVRYKLLIKKSLRFHTSVLLGGGLLTKGDASVIAQDLIRYVTTVEGNESTDKNKHTFNKYIESLGAIASYKEFSLFKKFYTKNEEDFSVDIQILDKDNKELQHIKVF